MRIFRVTCMAALMAVVCTPPIYAQTESAHKAPDPSDRNKSGQLLFSGERLLAGRLSGHTEDLPSSATRCVNCHEAGSVKPGIQGAAPTRTLKFVLSREGLMAPKARRGGPATVFTAETLCTLLRTGQDPAHVLIPAVMPRYEMTTANCEDLWHFLLSK